MRAAFLAQDRADIRDAVRSLAQGMATPNHSHWEDLKHMGGYLSGNRNVVLRYEQQDIHSEIITAVDSDYSADKTIRKSITGMSQRSGSHGAKSTSNMQTAVGVKASECEFHAIVHGGVSWIGNAFLFSRFGFGCEGHRGVRFQCS